MLAFLLAVATLLGQGPILPNQGGTITGVLRYSDNQPAANVRVAALAKPEEVTDLFAGGSYSALAETDAAGGFRLENVPPGKYYVMAGRVDAPTFFPGSVQVAEARVISITPGLSVSSIDFVVSNASRGRAESISTSNPSWIVPIQVRVEGGKVPLFAFGKFPQLLLTYESSVRRDSFLSPLDGSSITLRAEQGVGSAEFRASVMDLPQGYTVKSLTLGMANLTMSPFRLTTNAAGLGAVQQSITLVLTASATAPRTGVRVAGRLPLKGKRAIFISGTPGSIFADGTFEFLGVAPGRHAIVAIDSAGGESPLGTDLVVGDREIPSVALDTLSVVPADLERAAGAAPPAGAVPGTQLPLLSIRGRVIDSETKETFGAGKIVINGDYGHAFSLKDDGQFEIPKLVRGLYAVDVVVFGIGGESRTVTLEDQDAMIEFAITPEPIPTPAPQDPERPR